MPLRPTQLLSAILAVLLTAPSNAQRATSVPREYPHPRVIKIVFDLNSSPATPSDANPGLVAIANLVRDYESRPDRPRVEIAVVLHANTTDLAVDAAPARNGSIALMRSLAGKGVAFVVSRQSLASRGIAEREVQPFVRFGPTATVIFLDYEANGYIFDSSRSLANE